MTISAAIGRKLPLPHSGQRSPGFWPQTGQTFTSAFSYALAGLRPCPFLLESFPSAGFSGEASLPLSPGPAALPLTGGGESDGGFFGLSFSVGFPNNRRVSF